MCYGHGNIQVSTSVFCFIAENSDILFLFQARKLGNLLPHIHVIMEIIIKCQYNTHSDWFKQRAGACFMRVQSMELTNAHAIREFVLKIKAH